MTGPQTFPAALEADRASQDEAAPPGAGPQTKEQSERATREKSPPPNKPRPARWSARSAATARAAQRACARPRVRLTVLGGVLLVLAAFLVTGSAWTAPLAIVGVLALVVAWFGSRLDGRFVLEWGESGATFELRAAINAPEKRTQRAVPLGAPRRLDAVPADAVVIESTATTVEIDVAELKALIALAEAA